MWAARTSGRWRGGRSGARPDGGIGEVAPSRSIPASQTRAREARAGAACRPSWFTGPDGVLHPSIDHQVRHHFAHRWPSPNDARGRSLGLLLPFSQDRYGVCASSITLSFDRLLCPAYARRCRPMSGEAEHSTRSRERPLRVAFHRSLNDLPPASAFVRHVDGLTSKRAGHARSDTPTLDAFNESGHADPASHRSNCGRPSKIFSLRQAMSSDEIPNRSSVNHQAGTDHGEAPRSAH